MNKEMKTPEKGQIKIKNIRTDVVEKGVSLMESLMFIYGDPISRKDIGDIFLQSEIMIFEEEWEEILSALKARYQHPMSGLELIAVDGSYQLGTKKENYEYLKEFLHPIKKKSLTQASLETLSIIAYRQPVTKSEIEYIRGVKSDKAVNTLLEAGLICERGRLEKIGRPILYGTTEEFLRHFSLESLKELPPLSQTPKTEEK